MSADNTPRKSGLSAQWQPGQSGNPAGRPKGSRNKLSEQFLEALQADFAQHGIAAIERVCKERPHEYLKIIASLLPKQVEIRPDAFGGISDESLEALLSAAKSAMGITEPDKLN